jgi:eukaryotic translation initiation factor 2C
LGKVGKYLVYLPLELSETHLAHQKNLTPVQTSQVILKTAVPCFDRQNNIAKMIEKANINDSPLLKYNEVSTQLHMSRFIGKVLAAPDLEYGFGNNTKQKPQQRQKVSSSDIGREGKWDNRYKLFHTTATLKNWLAFSFGVKIGDQQLNEFINSVMKNASNHGLVVDEPLDYVIGDYNAFKKERDPALAAAKFFDETIKKHKNVQFLLVILPGTTPLYSVLKTYGDLRSGIISQAVDENTIIKQKGRYDRLASNISMKINAKLGGKNFVLSEANK